MSLPGGSASGEPIAAMETDESAPKEQTVKCLTAKVNTILFRKLKLLFALNSKPILTSTTPLKHLPNWVFPEQDANVVITTGENLKTSKIVAILSIFLSIQLPGTILLHWKRLWHRQVEENNLQVGLGIVLTLLHISKNSLH